MVPLAGVSREPSLAKEPLQRLLQHGGEAARAGARYRPRAAARGRPGGVDHAIYLWRVPPRHCVL
jgi:hypothetical protein